VQSLVEHNCAIQFNFFLSTELSIDEFTFTSMDPLSPRKAALPASFGTICNLDPRQLAQSAEVIANQCLEEQDEDGFEACLREAYNSWLALDYDAKVQLDGCEAVLLKLASHKKRDNLISAALQLLERCSGLMEMRRKKLGGLGNPQLLILHSETLSACDRADEASNVAKRAIDLLFRRYAHCKNIVDETSRDERILFGQAWQSLAVAEECQLANSEGDEERAARAVVALVHYRRGVKCCKDLLGVEDPATISMERRYNAAKKTLGKLAANAPKDQMPPAVAAYPTDTSAPAMIIVPSQPTESVSEGSPHPRPPHVKSSTAGHRRITSSELPVGARQGSAMRSRSTSEIATSQPKATSARQAVAAARLSQGIAPSVSLPLQRKVTATKLEPLDASAMTPRKHSSSTIGATPMSARSAASTSCESSPKKTPIKLVPIVLTTAYKRGLQMLFHAAVAKKRSFRALRSVYMFTRDLHSSFPHFQLVLDRSLFDSIRTNEHRLDAMERGPGHTNIEADVASKIRRRRSIDEIRKKKLDEEQVSLFADMDKRTERNARRYKLTIQSLTIFMQSLDRTIIRNAFRKWLGFLGPRRRMRPLRRAAAHLFKQIDRGLLRRRFVTWLRWLKDKKRSAFAFSRRRSNAQNENVKRALQLISDQEAENEIGKAKERRIRDEEEAYQRHRSKLEAMQAEILESIAVAEAASVAVPQQDPPKIPIAQFVETSVHAFLSALNAHENDSELVERSKHEFADGLRNYVASEDYEKEERNLPCDLAEMDILTKTISPFLVSLVLDEELMSDFNAELCRLVLKHLHRWIDFHHIFFEDDVLLASVRSGHVEVVEALLDGVPNFVVSSMGTYATDLLEACVNHSTKAVQLLEVLMLKCEGAVPFHDVKELSSSILHGFFDRWIPSTARSLLRRGTLYDASSDFAMRSRVMTLFERALLDVRSFSIPHDKEMADNQTLLSRMCGTGDLELVELYTSLLDDSQQRYLLGRKQSDGTTCLIQALRSRNSGLVKFLLENYEYLTSQLTETFDGLTVLQICTARGCGDDMFEVLKDNGVEEPVASEHPSPSRPSSQASRMSNIFGEASDDDIDHLFDDPKDSRRSSESDLSFSSPQPPDTGSSGFQRYEL
jgi:hypothetical protein